MSPVALKTAARIPVRTQKTVASHSATTGHGLSTFADALVVPQLAHACFHSDCGYGHPDRGFKRLRLVSKGVAAVLQRMMHSYTLRLGNEAHADIHQAVKFMKSIDLLRLHIVFPELELQLTGEQ